MVRSWTKDAICDGLDTNLFFDTYEENISIRSGIDKMCQECPVMRQCFFVGVSQKEYGVWGGVYLEVGEISKEFNNHKTKEDWATTWQALTMDGK